MRNKKIMGAIILTLVMCIYVGIVYFTENSKNIKETLSRFRFIWLGGNENTNKIKELGIL